LGDVNPGGKATTSVYSGPPVGQGSGSGAAIGAAQGASVGAVAGPIGMAIGAVVGAIGGAIAGAIGKKDPENYNFDQGVAIYKANPQAVLAIQNKYLPLAGLFDLNIKTNIPIYKRYGHMGEQKFLTDMATQIYQAAAQGKIGAQDTPQTIMVKVVQPWIDSWGFGPMSDPNAGFINMLLMGLIIDYVSGAQRNWTAIGGDYPFASLPTFALPTAANGSPSAATPGASAGNTLQHDTAATITTPVGTFAALPGGAFTFTPPGGVTQQIALTPAHTGGAGTLSITWNGTAAIATNSDGSTLTFNPSTGAWLPGPAGGTPAAGGSGSTPAPAGGTPAGASSNVPAFPGFQTALQNTTDPRLQAAWRENENGYTSTWSPVGGGLYTGQYPDGATQLQMVIQGNQVQVLRRTGNNWALYQGTLSADGVNASGKLTYYTASGQTDYPFQMTSALAAAPVTTPGVDPVTGAPVPVTPPSNTTVPIPAGYSVAATDAATGLPVYGAANGAYYTWTGTVMTPYSGTLTNGTAVSAGIPASSIPLPSLTSPGQQAYNTTNPLPYGTSPDLSSLSPAGGSSQTAPTQSVSAAGVSTSGSGTYMALGLAALAVIFATARPAPGGTTPRKRRGH
jgi:hypothetical protein